MTDIKQIVVGLTSAEAKRFLQKYGKNELTPQKKESFFQKVLRIICAGGCVHLFQYT